MSVKLNSNFGELLESRMEEIFCGEKYRTPISCLHCTLTNRPGAIWYLKGNGKGDPSCKYCQDTEVEPIPWSELK